MLLFYSTSAFTGLKVIGQLTDNGFHGRAWLVISGQIKKRPHLNLAPNVKFAFGVIDTSDGGHHEAENTKQIYQGDGETS